VCHIYIDNFFVDSLKKNKINTSERLVRTGAAKESSTEISSENKENGDYETVQFKVSCEHFSILNTQTSILAFFTRTGRLCADVVL
jgi:hypothetical protein